MMNNFGRAATGLLIFLLEALAGRDSLDYFQSGALALASLDCQSIETQQHLQYLRRIA
jgi:hypothetical protein